ncbi:MAG: type II toxin-antitoxin system VapC family toxin [Rhizomicrobium sp.]
MSVYLDASVLVALFLDDPFSERADAALRGKGLSLVVSDLAGAEFSSAVARHVRMGELSATEAQQAFADFDRWCLSSTERSEAHPVDMRIAQSLVRSLLYTLRTPDALHIAVAQRLGAELATFDQRMADCARAVGLPVAAL